MEAPPVQYLTTSDGYDIAYAVCGEGIPLVRVPSLFSHFALQWDRGILDQQFRTLAGHFQLVLFDSRGQGASTRGLTEGTALDDYVQDLELLVDRLGLDRFILLGTSAMGKVAVNYALKHPDRTLALLLYSYLDLARGSRLALHNLMRTDWPLYVQTYARVGWPWVDATNVVAVLRECMTQDDYVRQHLALQAASSDSMLQALEVPALVTATRAEARPLGGEEEARRLAALIPAGRLVVFDDVSGGFGSSDGGLPPIIAATHALLQESANRERRVERPLPHSRLSPREREVLRLIAAGNSNQQIANDLVLSLRTVERHITNLYGKIGARGKADATAYALRHGLDQGPLPQPRPRPA